jgi:hypothetical protein
MLSHKQHAKRKTVTAMDVVYALKRQEGTMFSEVKFITKLQKTTAFFKATT